MRVSEVMSSEVSTVEANDLAAAGLKRMEAEDVHHLVVMANNEVVGVVSKHDLQAARRDSLMSEVMTRSPVIAKPDQHVDKVANLLRGHSIGCLPVVDGEKLVGIVTVSDLLELIGRGRGKTDRTSVILNGRRFNNRQHSARSARDV